MSSIEIPKQNSTTDRESITFEGALVFVGANGSGKSRLGVWFENSSPSPSIVRIAAQRILTVQDPQPANFNKAEQQHKTRKTKIEQPADDFQLLINRLFKESQERDAQYTKEMRKTSNGERGAPPDAVLDQVVSHWNGIFDRDLECEAGTIKSSTKSCSPYPANQMSDGEKVALYLLGNILFAEKDAVIIVDEPEIHLHRALVRQFWSYILKTREDCTFVFITHDLDFAAFVEGDTVIWLRQYSNEGGEKWNWETIKLDPDSSLPEELKLEVLGSRTPTLLVEGELGDMIIVSTRKFTATVLMCDRFVVLRTSYVSPEH